MVDGVQSDESWSSTASAKQILALGDVEKDIARLLQLAASSLSLLAMPTPQGEEEGSKEPVGEERAELFVQEATAYFETLDSIQLALRKSLATIRRNRISPSSITAPSASKFVPPTFGVGPLSSDGSGKRGLQETRIERDAWVEVADALEKLREEAETVKKTRGDTGVTPGLALLHLGEVEDADL